MDAYASLGGILSHKTASRVLLAFNRLITRLLLKEQYKGFHSVQLNCTVENAIATTPYRVIGGLHHHGEFEPNPDIAGVGVSDRRIHPTDPLCLLLRCSSWTPHKLDLPRSLDHSTYENLPVSNTWLHQLQERIKETTQYVSISLEALDTPNYFCHQATGTSLV